jgi:long-chain fatty acid transport protein
MTILQVAPSVSWKVTERLALGFGPTVDVAIISFDPAFFAAPDDASGDGIFTFPTGSHTRPFWGGGFRAGALFSVTDGLDVGFSYTSPQWFEKWRFNARNEVGVARDLSLKATLPMILSGGVAYRGIDRLTLAADVRYFGYRDTDLFGTRLRDGGLGWRDVWAAAAGAQYALSERLSVRLGYLYNQNPIPEVGTLFNAQAPGLIQHQVAAGATMQLNDSLAMSLAYVHGFNNEISGAVVQVPGVNNTLSAESDSLVFGLHVRFGARRDRCPAPCDAAPCEVGR